MESASSSARVALINRHARLEVMPSLRLLRAPPLPEISLNSEFGIISGGANGIVATTAGSGSITITGSVTGNVGSAISATTAGGAITISGAHTVSGSTRGIETISGGGNISIQGVGETNGVRATSGRAIHADARRLRRQYQHW